MSYRKVDDAVAPEWLEDFAKYKALCEIESVWSCRELLDACHTKTCQKVSQTFLRLMSIHLFGSFRLQKWDPIPRVNPWNPSSQAIGFGWFWPRTEQQKTQKETVPNSNGPVEIVLSLGIQRAITGPEILQTSGELTGTGEVAGDFWAKATPAVFHPIPNPMKYWFKGTPSMGDKLYKLHSNNPHTCLAYLLW